MIKGSLVFAGGGGRRGRNKRRDVLLVGLRGMSLERESWLGFEEVMISSIGGTSGNGLYRVIEPSGFSTKLRRSVNLTVLEDTDMVSFQIPKWRIEQNGFSVSFCWEDK